jgi:hypothetical protein
MLETENYSDLLLNCFTDKFSHSQPNNPLSLNPSQHKVRVNSLSSLFITLQKKPRHLPEEVCLAVTL